MTQSPLHDKRLEYVPVIPKLLQNLGAVCLRGCSSAQKAPEALRSLFPHTFDRPAYELVAGQGNGRPIRVGVVFSGGPAAGGHNVITGLFDAGASLIGFLSGPDGLIHDRACAIDSVDAYRNQGGFDLIGSGRGKIETSEQLAKVLQTVQARRLDGLVIIGGDDSNTNAAILAEYFLQQNCSVKVVGVPKTIDGDLKSREIEISFGFDSACKTYAELIGNIARDAISSGKYYHFIKLMGRSASHIVLECALATQPNLAIITEEKRSLSQIVEDLADLIISRHKAGKEYGVVLLPEGIAELMAEMSEGGARDAHGNLAVSQIAVEKWLIHEVQAELAKRGFQGKFQPVEHFLGYEGRCCMPSNFDANYSYCLGLCAFLAVREGLTGVICAIQNLQKAPQYWTLKAIPIVQLMHLELRSGKQKPVIEKILVDVKGACFVHFSQVRSSWRTEDRYRYPGPIQFFGDPILTDAAPLAIQG